MKEKHDLFHGGRGSAVIMMMIVMAFAIQPMSHAQNNSFIDIGIDIATPRAVPNASEPLAKYSRGPRALSEEFFEEARAYHDGRDRVQNFTLARQYYYKAAQLRHNGARLNLGYMAFTGQGGTQDYAEARYWYNLAAREGEAAAVENLAMMDMRGLGQSRSFTAERAKAKVNANSLVKPKSYAALYAPKEPKAKERVPSGSATLKRSSLSTPKAQNKSAASKSQRRHSASTAFVPALEISLGSRQVITDATSFMPALRHQTFTLVGQEPFKAVEIIRVQSATSGSTSIDLTGPSEAVQAIISPLRDRVDLQGQGQRNALYIGGGLLFVALAGVFWFIAKLRELFFKGSRQKFFADFYETHRAELRETYVRFPEDERVLHSPENRWAVLLSVMMVRFAQKQAQTGDKLNVFAQYLLDEKGEPKGTARRKAYKLVPMLDKKIREDYRAFEHEKTHRSPEHVMLKNRATAVDYSPA